MDAFIGEIRAFTGNYAPRGWAFCDGALMNIYQNNVLHAVIGNKFGGDGHTTFALPNFTGKVPMGNGQGDILTNRAFGEGVGAQEVTLTEGQIPAHIHVPQAAVVAGTTDEPNGATWSETPASGRPPVQQKMYEPTSNVQMNAQAILSVGGDEAHNNMQPFLALNFIICVSDGEFPRKQ